MAANLVGGQVCSQNGRPQLAAGAHMDPLTGQVAAYAVWIAATIFALWLGHRWSDDDDR